MDFEVVGCELFGYDSHWRPTGQVSLRMIDDALHAMLPLPDITVRAQVVMFLQVSGQPMRLYSAMLPVEKGLVSTDSFENRKAGV